MVPLDPRQLPPPSQSGEEIRQAAREILHRPEFRQPGKPLLQRVVGWLRHLLNRITDVAHPGSAAALVLLLLIVAVIVVVAVRFERSVRRDPGSGVHVGRDLGRPATDWRAEAARFEAGGHWRDALRCRYRALVADLATRGLVDEIPGRTSGEYRAEVSQSAPASAADFAGATELFERAWYGAAESGPRENQQFDELAGRVLEGAGR